ncbi:uncharacterized protein BXZ73DRAFT_42577 [Epithele typhae]|uniref:uncharacterized protein n=1 Tax=Epithele typhae TaxID=378194 RepID=UPI002007E493|nr:uncharacterized protein BXZ73DRAFT_42577 [Epithele typhae]KAH9940854.1 hypothetical protein BXZ73DRAFT_42577 [Epithele typhae]
MSALSTPDLSPTLGPSTRPRRLSSRRGSAAAVDPYGTFNDSNMNPARALTSRLTIVRVPQVEMEEPPRRHRRHGSNASINSTSSGKEGAPNRMSFAFTSFAPSGPASPGRPASPSKSPHLRPSSPSATRFSGPLSHSKLSPEQVVDLARTSVNPRSPMISPNVAGGSGVQHHFTPVNFTPLPDSIYVPFIHRPTEVTSLLQAQPNARLFALLQQTFPHDARAPMGPHTAKAPSDAREWTFADLEYWLKRVDREEADDVVWTYKARRCVMAHSELIWERLKGALGVPPELDVEYDGGDSGPSTVVLNEDPMDSNVFEPDSPVASIRTLSDEGEVLIEPVFANQPPPSSAVDPVGMHSSLGDLREEDESEAAQDKKEETEQEIHGIRIITSPSTPAYEPVGLHSGSPMPPLGSPRVQPRFAPPAGANDKDVPYDVLHERGPGHPLFPSNFAQLALSPTLHPTKRSYSVSYPPRPAYLNPHSIRMGGQRTGSVDGGSGARLPTMVRPEWARGWDSSKHEYAVTTASAGSVSGAE